MSRPALLKSQPDHPFRPPAAVFVAAALSPREKQDQVVLSLRMDADLRSAFSWNTKQLFVYVQAEYVTPENKVSFTRLAPLGTEVEPVSWLLHPAAVVSFTAP